MAAQLHLQQTFGAQIAHKTFRRPRGSRGPELTDLDIWRARVVAATDSAFRASSYADVSLIWRHQVSDMETIVL